MIECSCERIWYKKRKRPKKRILGILIAVLIISIILLYYFGIVAKNIYNYSANYIYNYSTESLNYSIMDTLKNSTSYDELIVIEKDANGNVVLMTANSLKINTIARKTVSIAKKKLTQYLSNGVPIPLLSFFGLNFFSSYGRTVNFKTLNVASVDCDFLNEFKSMGINQTLHSIYIQLSSQVDVNLPLYNKQINSTSKILLGESVIVGKVPEIYLDSKNLS